MVNRNCTRIVSRVLQTNMLCLIVITCCERFVTSFILKNTRELQNTTCFNVYNNAVGNKSILDLASPIGGVGCSPGTYYHCLPLTNDMDKYLQFCSDWIWIEAGKCPSIYIEQQAIQPYDCNKDVPGCPSGLYKSYTYYRYKECFTNRIKEQTIRKQEENKTTQVSKDTNSGTDTSENTNITTGGVPWFVWVIIAIVVFALLLALGVWICRKISKTLEQMSNQWKDVIRETCEKYDITIRNILNKQYLGGFARELNGKANVEDKDTFYDAVSGYTTNDEMITTSNT